ncbi:1853_t:CDS:2 [Cetraspora pellucida]|uniref:1853_t:CDS:1 n=1 Tax=Cetraspora pellucida TaxID=1433469 RepID=A0ACA9LQH9_9GLOM|nr:1853_t:CDS:2 [Cetraspora pellucida]
MKIDDALRNKEQEVRYKMILESVALETFDIDKTLLNDEKERNRNKLEAPKIEKDDNYVNANTSRPKRLGCIEAGCGALIKSMPKKAIKRNRMTKETKTKPQI